MVYIIFSCYYVVLFYLLFGGINTKSILKDNWAPNLSGFGISYYKKKAKMAFSSHKPLFPTLFSKEFLRFFAKKQRLLLLENFQFFFDYF